MKKNLFYFFSALFFFSSITRIQSQCNLDQIGTANFVANSGLSDMAVAANGTVYTFAYNSSANKFQLYSATYPGAFTLLATITTSTTVRPAIAISKLGKVSVLIRDENAAKVAKVYYLSGGSLLQQGGAISTGQATDLSLAFNAAGEEYVVYSDVSNSNIATVKKWNSGSSTWINVGTGAVSAGAAAYNSIAIDKNNSPVLAYQDATTTPANRISAKKYNGTSWVAMGAGVVSTNPATNPKIVSAKNNISTCFLGYTEISTSSAIVQKNSGGAWSIVGAAVTNISSGAGTFGLDVDPLDLPLFTALPTTPPYPVAYRFGGAAWSALVSYITPSTASCTNIMLDGLGNPYYFFVDQPNNNALNVRRTSTPSSIVSQPTSTTVCDGNTGSFTLGVSGGTPTYQWQYLSVVGFQNVSAPYTNGTSAVTSFTASAAINQDQVRCVINPGCINLVSNTATLTVNTLSVTSTSTNPSCYNTLDGAISSTVTGGNAPYTYSWSPMGGTNATANGLYGTTYTLNTIDNIGCTTNATFTLSTPPGINSSFSGNQNICLGSATTLTVNASGGVGAFTYSWSPSTNLTPTTGSVVTANPSSSITYGVQITDSIGCVFTNTVGVNILTTPAVSVNASSPVICNGASTSISASGSGDTYAWMPGSLNGASQVVAPSSSTVYTVTATNTLTGCSKTATLSITVNATPSANAGPAKVLTCAGTTTILSGSTVGGVTYNWSGPGIVSGGTTLNPVVNAVGTYDLNVISAGGCSSNYSPVSVTQNTTSPTPTANNSGTLTCSATTVALTGSPASGVTYQWTGPGIVSGATLQNATANAAGTYTLKVTSTANSCTNTALTTVTQNTILPVPSASNSGVLTCVTTSVTLTGAPATGVSYLWSGPGITGPTTAKNTSANAAGTYTLKVTSSTNGCTNTAVTSVTQNTALPSPTAGTTGTLSCISNSVTLNGAPGTGVTYLWTGPSVSGSTTTQTTTANAPGTYTLKVTNSVNGCTNTAMTNVTQNMVLPSVTASTTGTLTCSALTVGLNGGPASGVTYLWSGPGVSGSTTTQNTSANLPGDYTLTATSSVNGCKDSTTTSVIQNATPPSPTASVSGSITCSNPSVALNGSPGAGVTYLWSGPSIVSGANTQNAVANAAGVYSLSVTGISTGCSATATIAVAQNTAAPAINVIPSQTTTCYAPTATLTTFSSADPASSYAWASPVAGMLSNYNISNPEAYAAGIFTVDVTDTNSGCTSTATVEVVSDFSFPVTSLSFNPTNTLTCTDPLISAIVTTSTSTVAFSWLGSGITSGAATATATINQPGNYTVSTTNTMNGCASTETLNVMQDITLPVFSVSSTSTSICPGNSITITATGANTYSWSTGQTTASIIDSPAASMVYTVTGYGANGCSDVVTEAITVNALPSLSVTGALTICKGSTASLTANGATSYTWSTGATTASISETLTITTTYTVTGDNGSCTASLFPTVSIISSKDITGTITSTTGATTGDVILYKYTAALSRWDSVTITPFSSSYAFTNIDSGLYVVRALPVASNIQVTYGDSSVSWQDAKVINHGCTNTTTENIKLIPLANIGTGPGQLSGTIIEGNGFGHRVSSAYHVLVPGNPIGGIIVKGGKNPGGQMFVQTTTNAIGQYTLTGFPVSSSTDYFIFVDIPGLDTNLTYHTLVTSSDPVIANLDFYVDSMYINPLYVTKVKEESTLFENKVVLYPNPANQYFSIQYELVSDSDVAIELYDLIGKKVRTLVPQARQAKNKYDHRIETDDLNSGVYFVKLKLNGHDTTIKLILTK